MKEGLFTIKIYGHYKFDTMHVSLCHVLEKKSIWHKIIFTNLIE